MLFVATNQMQEKLALRREARRRLAEERQNEEELRRDSSGLVVSVEI